MGSVSIDYRGQDSNKRGLAIFQIEDRLISMPLSQLQLANLIRDQKSAYHCALEIGNEVAGDLSTGSASIDAVLHREPDLFTGDHWRKPDSAGRAMGVLAGIVAARVAVIGKAWRHEFRESLEGLVREIIGEAETRSAPADADPPAGEEEGPLAFIAKAEGDYVQPFEPDAAADERERIARGVVVRRGQPDFRKRLLELYGGRCVITGCEVEDVLEAAHIVPYCGEPSKRPSGFLWSEPAVSFHCGSRPSK